tara:strand:+ start:16229 stop:17356 length:1128 start_codon:yes stop_codon:yes gene_type:complete
MEYYLERIKEFFSDLSKKMTRSSFRGDVKNRLKLYNYFASGLESDLNINIYSIIDNKISRNKKKHDKKFIVKRYISKPGGKEQPFLKYGLDIIDNGGSSIDIFGDGWITPNEEMLIKSSKENELPRALRLTSELIQRISNIKKEVKSQITYPIILLVVMFVMMYAFSFFFIPILTEVLPVEEWESSQQNLYYVSMFLQNNAITIPIVLLTIIGLIIYTLPNFSGEYRRKIDAFIPWSIYKDFNAALFLISLSTLIKNGTSFIKSLEGLKKTASPYVKYEIQEMIDMAYQAEVSNSTAINVHMLGEVGDDIEAMGEYGSFDQILRDEGDAAIEKITEDILGKAKVFRYVILLSLVGYILWALTSFIAVVSSVSTSI